jgi:hypothetical protein
MNVHALKNPGNLPSTIRPMVTLQGAASDPDTMDRVARGILDGLAVNHHTPIDLIDGWYQNPDNVIRANGKPPASVCVPVAEAYIQCADELRKRGVTTIPGIVYQNPEACPDLQNQPNGPNFIDAMIAARLDPTSRGWLDPLLSQIHPSSLRNNSWATKPEQKFPAPPVWRNDGSDAQYQLTYHFNEWTNSTNALGYFAARNAWWSVIGANYAAARRATAGIVTNMARTLAVSGGPNSGRTDWETFNNDGWPNVRQQGRATNEVQSPQCYLVPASGLCIKQDIKSDPRWVGLLTTLDTLLSMPSVIPTICTPRYAGCSPAAYGIFLAFCRAIGCTDAVWWNTDAPGDWAELAHSIDLANAVTITPDLRPITPVDLHAKSISINGVNISENQWVSMYGTQQ